jgi:hypothetical protein
VEKKEDMSSAVVDSGRKVEVLNAVLVVMDVKPYKAVISDGKDESLKSGIGRTVLPEESWFWLLTRLGGFEESKWDSTDVERGGMVVGNEKRSPEPEFRREFTIELT